MKRNFRTKFTQSSCSDKTLSQVCAAAWQHACWDDNSYIQQRRICFEALDVLTLIKLTHSLSRGTSWFRLLRSAVTVYEGESWISNSVNYFESVWKFLLRRYWFRLRLFTICLAVLHSEQAKSSLAKFDECIWTRKLSILNLSATTML